ncbi:MAG: hypothetical protein U5L74_08985 [Ideonella sp.]|nr:hypothetical protein [Ideonella sp.]
MRRRGAKLAQRASGHHAQPGAEQSPQAAQQAFWVQATLQVCVPFIAVRAKSPGVQGGGEVMEAQLVAQRTPHQQEQAVHGHHSAQGDQQPARAAAPGAEAEGSHQCHAQANALQHTGGPDAAGVQGPMGDEMQHQADCDELQASPQHLALCSAQR